MSFLTQITCFNSNYLFNSNDLLLKLWEVCNVSNRVAVVIMDAFRNLQAKSSLKLILPF